MSSSFFQNRDCEYFPCHSTDRPEDFNCLFCYCPLYALGRACGGNFRYTKKGIKDCTLCRIPHERENYRYILSRYPEIVRVAREQDEKHPPEANSRSLPQTGGASDSSRSDEAPESKK